MPLGDVKMFRDGSYDVRAIVDGLYIVRLRNRKTGVEIYKIWTPDEREAFDRRQLKIAEVEDRARQIYERHLAGETFTSLGREYGIRPERARQICAKHMRNKRLLQK